MYSDYKTVKWHFLLEMDEQRRELRAILRKTLLIIVKQIEEEVLYQLNKPKRMWERKWISRRPCLGASALLLKELAIEDPREYRDSMRMTEESFNWLLSRVEPVIKKSDTIMRRAIPAKIKLQALLYTLATGNSLRSISHFFRISKPALSLMIPDICDAIYNALQDFIQVPRNGDEWKAIECGFRKSWNFPGCCGAIDGKHVVIKAPFEAGSYFYNYKQQNSIVLMAVVDDDYCFKYIDVGCNGRISDGGVFRNCSLSYALEDGLLPDNHIIVGDAAFPLKKYLMKPYQKNLTQRKKIYNYRLSRARRIVENAFGILVSRFRIFERPLPYNPNTVVKIVKACCALHNWLRISNSPISVCTIDVEDTDTGNILLGNWRDLLSDGLLPIPRHIQNHSSANARKIREDYADYFIGDGAVEWQTRMIY